MKGYSRKADIAYLTGKEIKEKIFPFDFVYFEPLSK
jgi:hypothetical protein